MFLALYWLFALIAIGITLVSIFKRGVPRIFNIIRLWSGVGAAAAMFSAGQPIIALLWVFLAVMYYVTLPKNAPNTPGQ